MSRLASFASSAFTCALAPLAALMLVACGGDDSPGTSDAMVVMLIDAATPDAPTAIDAAPPACTGLTCDGVCIDPTTDEAHCGDCETACGGGHICGENEAGDTACVCMQASFVPPTPAVVFGQMADGAQAGFPGVYVGFGAYPGADGTIDAIAAGIPKTGLELNHEYTLSADTLGTPPFVAAGYDVNIQGFQIAAAFYATSGTVVFTEGCSTGVKGTLTNATFQGVTSITDPTIDPNGCTFEVPTVTFSIGQACPDEPPVADAGVDA